MTEQTPYHRADREPSHPDRQEHLHSNGGWCSLADDNRGFCPGGIVKRVTRWRVVRRVGWSLVIHPASDVVLITPDHAAAIAYADRLARQEERP